MSPIAPFPHRYTVSFADGQLAAPPRAPIAAGAPPQFGGSDRVWSPEELLVGAALVCLSTTFAALARRDELTVHDWRGSAAGVLEKSATGPTFTSIELMVELAVAAADQERANRLIEQQKSTASSRAPCVVRSASRCRFTSPDSLGARARRPTNPFG